MSFERRLLPYVLLGLTNVFAIGLGMGVPVFAILFGFPVGWWYARRTAIPETRGSLVCRLQLTRLLQEGVVLATLSAIVLAVIWGSQMPTALAPGFSAAEWGIPLILYTSRASVIGWFVLMLVISPLLQFMAVLTGGVAAFVLRPIPRAHAIAAESQPTD